MDILWFRRRGEPLLMSEHEAYLAYFRHQQECSTCREGAKNGVLCPEGAAMHNRWKGAEARELQAPAAAGGKRQRDRVA